MEQTLIQSLLSLGVGGIIAGIVIVFWRQDRNDMDKRWEAQVKDMLECRKLENTSRDRLADALNRQSDVMSGVKTLIEHWDEHK